MLNILLYLLKLASMAKPKAKPPARQFKPPARRCKAEAPKFVKSAVLVALWAWVTPFVEEAMASHPA